MPNIEKSGCHGCRYGDWDADGCTCKLDGLLVWNPAVGCKYRKADEDKPLTNGDRIRAMTDEELSVFLGGIADNCSYNTCDNCPLYGACVDVPLSRDKWLRQEAEKR